MHASFETFNFVPRATEASPHSFELLSQASGNGYGTTESGYETTNADAGVGIDLKGGDSEICQKIVIYINW